MVKAAHIVISCFYITPSGTNTAFGVSTIRKDYLQVASLLQLSWRQRLIRVVLPAVIPAEMLLGELGVGYLTWMEWNNLHIVWILFAILTVGTVGVTLDAGFSRLARFVTYTE